MIARIGEQLGHGIYTPEEVAFYVRERTQTINRWLSGTKSGKPVVTREFANNEKFVSFLDFIQALAIATIRRQFKVPLQTLRQAVDEARKRHKVEYPFAMEHTTYLFQRINRGSEERELNKIDDDRVDADDGKDRERLYEVFIKLRNENLVQVTGAYRGNYALKEIVELYLRDVTFNPETGFATEYCPWRSGDLRITMNPRRRFGEPLTPSGYTATTLADAVRIEGSIEAAAKTYGVDRREVELACGYLDFLRIPAPRG